MSAPVSLPAMLESFFTQRLMQQRQASPHTISSYRDTFRQFLKFTEQRFHKAPSLLTFQEINAPLIASQLTKRRLMPHRFNGCSPFRASALHGLWSHSSHEPKSMPCSRRRISAHGLAGVITPSFCWPCRLVCAFPR
jgi:Phage integrase, N-terminal SAM-like domain